MKSIFFVLMAVIAASVLGACSTTPKVHNEGDKYYSSRVEKGKGGAMSEQTDAQKDHTEEMFNMNVDSDHPVLFNEGDEFYGFTPKEIAEIKAASNRNQYLNSLAFANMIGEQEGNVGPRSNNQGNGFPPYAPGQSPSGGGVRGSTVTHVPYQGEPAPPPLYR